MLSDRLIAVTGGGSHLYDYGKTYPQITGGWQDGMQYSSSVVSYSLRQLTMASDCMTTTYPSGSAFDHVFIYRCTSVLDLLQFKKIYFTYQYSTAAVTQYAELCVGVIQGTDFQTSNKVIQTLNAPTSGAVTAEIDISSLSSGWRAFAGFRTRSNSAMGTVSVYIYRVWLE